VKFFNYFDIPKEEIENRDVMTYLENIYKKLGAPKGRVLAWYTLPHENRNVKRLCVFYRIDEQPSREAAK